MKKKQGKILGRIKDYNLLNQFHQLFASKTELRDVLPLVLDKLGKSLKLKGSAIFLLDENEQIIIDSFICNLSQEELNSAQQDYKNFLAQEGENIFPLSVQKQFCLLFDWKNNRIGLLFLYFSEKNTQQAQSFFLEKFSFYLGIFISKTNELKQMQKSMKQLSSLYNISHHISGKLNIEEILAQTLPYLAKIFEAEKIWMMINKEGTLSPIPPYVGLSAAEITYLYSLTKEQLDISQAILSTGQIMQIPNPFQKYSVQEKYLQDYKMLLIPLKMANTPLGVIYIADRGKKVFTLLDSQLATSIGNQLAAALISVYLHKKLTKENIALEHANNLKTQFLANMSHELRTPMHSIIGYTHCLLDGIDGELEEEQKKDLQKVLISAEHLLGLINDVLDLSKIDAGKMEVKLEAFNLVSCLNDVLFALEKLASNKGLEIIRDYSEQLPVAIGDYARVRQILLNLMSNAIKFTEKGWIKITVQIEKNYLNIMVQDTGIGISEQAIPYIFEEFRQADGSTTRKYGGTGLGLAITKKLVEMQKGKLSVESTLGKGSTFKFTLPRKKEC